MTSKEKKEILNSFILIESRIMELEEELEKLWSRATLESQSINGTPNGSGNTAKMQISIERMEKIKKLINDERDELSLVQYKIMAAIKKLPNITERRIIYLKYIGKLNGKYHKNLPLWKIANKLGYSYDRVKHLHGLALLHLEL